MGLMSRRKGKAHERDVANRFKRVVPEAKRGISQARGGGKESPDVEIPHLHIECKHRKQVSLYATMKQARQDCRGDKKPAGVVRLNRQPDLPVMYLEDFIDLFGEFLRWREGVGVEAAKLGATLCGRCYRTDGGALNAENICAQCIAAKKTG